MFPSCARSCPAGVVLLLSAKSGDVNRAEALLRRRSCSPSSPGTIEDDHGDDHKNLPPPLDPDATRDARGNTALHLAAIHGHSTIARALLDAGASTEATVSSGINEGLTPLRLAAERGHLSTVRVLLEAGADAAAEDLVDRATPLHAAAEAGHTSVVVELARRGEGGGGVAGVANHRLEARAVSGQTPLRWALSLGRVGAAAALLRAGADPDAPDRRGACCLHTVAGLKSAGGGDPMNGDLSMSTSPSWLSSPLSPPAVMAKLLLSAGAAPDLARGAAGWGRRGRRRRGRHVLDGDAPSTPLTTAGPASAAAAGGDGGSGGSTSVGETPLHVAARESSFEVAQILLLHGADPNAKTSAEEGGLSPLHCCAAEPGNDDSRRAIVRALLEAGAAIDAVSADGVMTPLKLACLNAAVGCVEELLRWGADDVSCVPRRRRRPSPPSHLVESASVSDRNPIGLFGSTPLDHHEAVAKRAGLDVVDASAAAAAAAAATDLPRLESLVGSRVPVSARDAMDCRVILRMLCQAPLDRAWRRRGWLVMLYARATRGGIAAPAGFTGAGAGATHWSGGRFAGVSAAKQGEMGREKKRLRGGGGGGGDGGETGASTTAEGQDPEASETSLRETVLRLFEAQGDQSVLRRVVSWL